MESLVPLVIIGCVVLLVIAVNCGSIGNNRPSRIKWSGGGYAYREHPCNKDKHQ